MKKKTRRQRDALVERNLNLVRFLARSIARERTVSVHVDIDDLVQAGTIGLILAAERWQPDGAARFETYAYHYIDGAIRDATSGTSPRGEELCEEDSISEDPGPRYLSTELLNHALAELPDREITILREHYFQDLPLRLIGDQLHISERSVVRLHKQGLQKLRVALGGVA